SPDSTFIRVVLPAPFSPRSPWISPAAAVKSTPRRATVSPKRLATPRISTRGARPAAGAPAPVTSHAPPARSGRPVDDLGDRLAGHHLAEDRPDLLDDLRRDVAHLAQLHAAAGPHLEVAG